MIKKRFWTRLKNVTRCYNNLPNFCKPPPSRIPAYATGLGPPLGAVVVSYATKGYTFCNRDHDCGLDSTHFALNFSLSEFQSPTVLGLHKALVSIVPI